MNFVARLDGHTHERTLASRQSRWLRSLQIVAVFAGLSLSWAAAAMEAVSACYNGTCYGSMSAAISAMRLDAPYGTLARNPKSTVIESSAEKVVVRITYTIDSREPETLLGAGYTIGGWGVPETGCTPSETASSRCADETWLIAAFSAKIKNPDCSYRNERVDGYYVEPFTRSQETASQSRRGALDFRTPQDRWLRFEVNCPGWSDREYRPSQHQLIKSQHYICPEGFYARSGWAPGHAPAGTSPSQIIEGMKLCRPAVETKYITVTTTQIASCSTAHPCHPTTGDKSRAEVDFVFAGRAFVRSYHSLGQINGNSGSGPNWIHTYEARLEYSGGYNVVNEDGYLEGFYNLGWGKFRALNSADRMLIREDGKPFRFRDGRYVKEFNNYGQLSAVVDEQEPRYSTTLAYANGLLDSVTDATGRSLKFVYDSGRLVEIKLPDTTSVRYGYDEVGNLTRVEYSDGSVRQYHYHEAGLALPRQIHLLTGITSENGSRYATFAYDSSDRVVSSVLHGSEGQFVEETHLDYLSDTSVAVTTDGRGTRLINIKPGMYRRPLTISDEAGTTTNTYRTDGRISSKVLPNGSRVEYEYADTYQSAVTEAAGTASERRLITERDSFNRILRREMWSKDGSASKLLSKTVWTYNARGQVSTVSEQDPELGLSRVTTSRYCEELDVSAGNCPIVGLLTSIDGPRNDVNDRTTYEYRPTDDPACATDASLCAWRKGDLWKLTNAKGQTTETLRYDGAGRSLSTKDGNGVITDSQYDLRGRLINRTVRASN